MPELSVRYHLPAPALRRLISTYFFLTIEGVGRVEDLIHPQWSSFQFVLSGGWSTSLGAQTLDPMPNAVVVGPTSRALHVRGTAPTMTVGIGILPLGWARLVGRSAHDYADQVAPLSSLCAPADRLLDHLRRHSGDEARIAYLDAFLIGRLKARPEISGAVARAHRALLDPDITTVDAWARGLGITTRQLERVSRRAFGFAPKLLLRRQRFLRTLSRMRENPAASAVGLVDEAYVDQSHFIRDFHRFVGMSPRAYFALPRRLLEAGANARNRLLGAALHGLHAAPED